MGHNLKSFIQSVLINEIGRIQENGHHYLSFSLISQGIEFLGYCLDNKDLHPETTKGKKKKKDSISKTRFQNAIDKLFPNSYNSYKNKGSSFNLFENLRCGLVHVLIPQNKLELVTEKEAKENNLSHLKTDTIRGHERLVLVAEVFYNDFKKACEKVIKKFENNDLNGNNIPPTLLETNL